MMPRRWMLEIDRLKLIVLTKPRLRNKFRVEVSVLAKKFQNFRKLRLEND